MATIPRSKPDPIYVEPGIADIALAMFQVTLSVCASVALIGLTMWGLKVVIREINREDKQ